MAATLFQKTFLARGDHGGAKIETLDRAAGALADWTVQPDDHRRAVVALDQPRRDHADHARRPPFPRRNQARGIGELGFELTDRRSQHVLFDAPALVVERVHLAGDGGDGFRVILGQEPRPERGLAGAPAGIDAWAEHEAEFAGVRRLGQLRRRPQGCQPRVALLGSHLDALGYQRPVEAGKRHQIADRTERHQSPANA